MDFHDKARVIVMKTYFSLYYFLVALLNCIFKIL